MLCNKLMHHMRHTGVTRTSLEFIRNIFKILISSYNDETDNPYMNKMENKRFNTET